MSIPFADVAMGDCLKVEMGSVNLAPSVSVDSLPKKEGESCVLAWKVDGEEGVIDVGGSPCDAKKEGDGNPANSGTRGER